MRYSVDPQSLSASADRMARALQILGTVRVGEDLAPLGHAFAGGATAARLKGVTNQWDSQLFDARALLRSLGGALAEAAEGYGALESLMVVQLGTAGSEAP